MHITREKRPDRVMCKWGEMEVELNEERKVVFISAPLNFPIFFPLSEIPNLIKALGEVGK